MNYARVFEGALKKEELLPFFDIFHKSARVVLLFEKSSEVACKGVCSKYLMSVDKQFFASLTVTSLILFIKIHFTSKCLNIKNIVTRVGY